MSEVDWRSFVEGPPHDFPERLVDVARSRFAGRRPELAEIRDAWSDATAGRTTLMLVAGEPGVGKSRLAAESARQAHAVGAEVLYGRCDPGGAIPYQPFAEALTDHLQRHGSLTGHPTTDRELAPLLPDVPDGVEDAGGAVSDGTRLRFYAAVAEWFDALTSERPVLLVLDDIGWGDTASLDLLVHLMEKAPRLRLLIVATYRDNPADRSDDMVDALGSLRRLQRVRSVPLSGLSESEISELVHLAGDDQRLEVGALFAGRLFELTGGSPFLVLELLGWLSEQGLLEQYAAEGWPADSDDVPVPSGVSDMVAQRLLPLSDTARTHLRSAALIGSEFDLAVLAGVTGDIDRDELVAELEDALALGVIGEVDGEPFTFRFTHDIVRESLLLDMSATRTALLHQEIADAIEKAHADDLAPHSASLGRHLALTADSATRLRAVDHLVVAAERALSRAAPDLATRHLESALEIAQRDGAAPAQIARLTFLYGVALRRSGSIEAKGVLLRAGRLAEQTGDDELFIQAALSNSRGMWSVVGRVDPPRTEALERSLELLDADESGRDRRPERAALLASLAQELTYHPDRERTAALSRQAEDLAREVGDRSALIRTLASRHSVLWHPAAFRERVVITDELEQLTLDAGDQWEATAMSLGFQAAIEGGRPATARRRLTRLADLAEYLRQPAIWAYTHLWTGVQATLEGDLAEGERAAGEAYAHNQRIGSPDGDAWMLGQLYPIRWHQGRLGELESSFVDGLVQFPGLPVLAAALTDLRAQTGDLDGARDALEQVPMDQIDAERAHLDQLVAVACLVRAAHRLGDVDLAERMLPRLDPYANQHVTNGSCHFGSVHHYVGLAHLTAGRLDESRTCFEAAWRANERLESAPLVGRSLIGWGEALFAGGDSRDREEAGDKLDRARVIADRFDLAGVVADIDTVWARHSA